jgi:hypothetical protein
MSDEQHAAHYAFRKMLRSRLLSAEVFRIRRAALCPDQRFTDLGLQVNFNHQNRVPAVARHIHYTTLFELF